MADFNSPFMLGFVRRGHGPAVALLWELVASSVELVASSVELVAG